jgi:hypothetical protein
MVSPFFSEKGQEIRFGGLSPSAAVSADPFNQSRVPRSDLARPASTPIDHNSSNLVPSNTDSPFLLKPLAKARAASVSILPPLPKPTPVARTQSTIKPPETSTEKAPTPTPKPTQKRVAQRKSRNVTSPLDESAPGEAPLSETLEKQPIVFKQPAEPEDEPSPLAAKSAAVAPRPASAMAGLQSKATTTKKRAATPIRPTSAAKRSKMVDQSTQTQTLSGRDHTIARKTTPANDVFADVPTNVPALVADTPSPASLPESYLDTVDKFVANHKARPAPKELWQAPGYAEAGEEQRLLLLNDFICDNLENADFLQLCQDTEKAWRRIGLGM